MSHDEKRSNYVLPFVVFTLVVCAVYSVQWLPTSNTSSSVHFIRGVTTKNQKPAINWNNWTKREASLYIWRASGVLQEASLLSG